MTTNEKLIVSNGPKGAVSATVSQPLTRHSANPIITPDQMPVPCSAVFNAGATWFDGHVPASAASAAPGATRIRFNASDTTLGQTPQSAPTVFNWFLPNYTPGGAITAAGLVAPEMQITQETQIVQCVNFVRSVVSGNGQAGNPLPGATNNTLDEIVASRAPWETLYNTEIAAGKTVTQAVTTVVDRLDILLMAGNLKARYAGAPTPNPRASIITAGVNSVGNDRMINLLYLIANSPEFLHQK